MIKLPQRQGPALRMEEYDALSAVPHARPYPYCRRHCQWWYDCCPVNLTPPISGQL
jgi:hypothetical protein